MGSVFFGYFSFYATQMTIESYQIGERTAGLLPIPLWLPQIGMSLGLIVMTLALLDDLVLAVGGRTPVYGRSEEAQMEAEGLRRADSARLGV